MVVQITNLNTNPKIKGKVGYNALLFQLMRLEKIAESEIGR